eukprot:scaffold11053_cov110-Isochrysis_galbana.AAC.3
MAAGFGPGGEISAGGGSVAGRDAGSPAALEGPGTAGGRAPAPAADAEGVAKCDGAGGVGAALRPGAAACSLVHSPAACHSAGAGRRRRLLSCASSATCQTRAMSRISRAPSASARRLDLWSPARMLGYLLPENSPPVNIKMLWVRWRTPPPPRVRSCREGTERAGVERAGVERAPLCGT